MESGSVPYAGETIRAMARLAADPDRRVRLAVLPGVWRKAVAHRNDKNGEAHFISGPYDPVVYPALLALAFDPDPYLRSRALRRWSTPPN